VEALLAEDPSLPQQLAFTDHWVLAEAARAGRAEAVTVLLEQGFDQNRAQHGYTALHWAAFGGHADVVELLLENGADPARRDPHYHSAAWGWAEHSGHEALARHLLTRAAADGHLVAAVELGDEETARRILAEHPDAADRDDGWVTPLGVAASLGHMPLMTALVDAGANVERTGGDGRAPLEQALDAGQERAATWLRAHGASEPTPAGA
jgi:ankyrin repeat protein